MSVKNRMLLFCSLMRSNHWRIEEKKKAGFPIGCNLPLMIMSNLKKHGIELDMVMNNGPNQANSADAECRAADLQRSAEGCNGIYKN